MMAIDRRSVLRGLLMTGAAATMVGLALEAETAEARRFRRPVRRAVVTTRRVTRRVYRRAYRRRFWRCVYVYGNRVCNWHYY
jgi:hypothetical protein